MTKLYRNQKALKATRQEFEAAQTSFLQWIELERIPNRIREKLSHLEILRTHESALCNRCGSGVTRKKEKALEHLRDGKKIDGEVLSLKDRPIQGTKTRENLG